MMDTEKYKNPACPIEERVQDLMSHMTLREKIAVMIETSPANERLGIPKYNHGNEALHGIVRPGHFTVFPQAIALGATFDDALIEEIAGVISDESRAVYHHGKGVCVTEEEYENRYCGLLTFWSPDLNICRDPRWGRTGETYGEDPYLCGKMGAAFVRGLQGNDPHYLKAVATPKHYTANNEEHNRFSCNAVMSEKTLREYHLEPFRRAVVEGHPAAVMAAYNAINGEPCHQNPYLLKTILREEWGFDGYVVSDCSGIARLWDAQRKHDDPADAASAALNAGIDLECGSYSPYEHFYVEFLERQLAEGKTTQARIDEACRRVLTARFRLGQFDPEELVPFSRIPLSVVGCEKHAELAYRAAAESIVLLKNNGILPLSPDMKVAVVGNNAHLCQFGDYSGKPKNTPVSPLDGILAAAGDNVTAVRFMGVTSAKDYTVITADHLRD
ncbi:MAG: glycoside hydrolase family 3 protein, partial [Clostridia bacterium]|nr:glycoside hydrolase family 3 protein [Clostridia bacterium]